MEPTDSPERKDQSFSAEAMFREGFAEEAKNFKKPDSSVEEFKALGYPAWAVREMGFSAKEMKEGGYSPRALKMAGFSEEELGALD